MTRKIYQGPNGGQYIMRYGKKKYLPKNKFGDCPGNSGCYSCEMPAEAGASGKERARACKKDNDGPYLGLQPCVEDCYQGNENNIRGPKWRAASGAAAAEAEWTSPWAAARAREAAAAEARRAARAREADSARARRAAEAEAAEARRAARAREADSARARRAAEAEAAEARRAARAREADSARARRAAEAEAAAARAAARARRVAEAEAAGVISSRQRLFGSTPVSEAEASSSLARLFGGPPVSEAEAAAKQLVRFLEELG